MNALNVGTYFYRYHDGGGKGYAKIILGKILKVCPKTYLVLWEFGNTQYIKHDSVDNILKDNSTIDKGLMIEFENSIKEIIK